MRSIAAALLLFALLPSAAHADAGCAAISAYEANAATPHVVDPTGDLNTLAAATGGSGQDVIAAWVGTTSAHVPTTYTLNLSVGDLGAAPAGTAFLAEFGDESVPTGWVSMSKMVDGNWEFAGGIYFASLFLVGDLYEPLDRLDGIVNEATGTVTLRMPATIMGPEWATSSTPFPELRVQSGTWNGLPNPSVGVNVGPPRAFAVVSDTLANAEHCPIDMRPPPEEDDE